MKRAPVSAQVALLAEASRLLADSLDYETTLTTVAGMALPHLGAWCFVDLNDSGTGMRRVAVIHPDPEMQALVRGLEKDWSPERDDPVGMPRAMRTRRSEVIEGVTDEMLVRASRTEENLRILRRLDIGSLMSVPLIARGQVLGAITFVAPQGRAFTQLDLALAEDLGARCAIAIDNARLYREARQAQRDAEAAQMEAEEANRAKSLFLATMSHEIRTPLNAVIGYVDLLDTGIGGVLSPSQAQYLERIQRSNRHLLGLINDVLDFAKVDGGEMQVQHEETAARPVVEAALELVYPLLEGRTLSLSEECGGDPETQFVADVDRVRQIVVNLLSNAIKFTPDGGRIQVTCGQADQPDGAMVVAKAARWAYIRVEDTGIGIPPEMMQRLFQPFVQADTGYTRSRDGTGLGLAISRRLARWMDGDLIAESRPHEGSTFTLWMPAPPHETRAAAPAATPDQATRTAQPVRGVAEIGKKILSQVDQLAQAFVQRLREERPASFMDELSDSELKDHTTSLLADLSQSIVLLEDSMDDAVELLRDGSAIQRVIADRHGLQRHRMGWTEEAVEAEFDLLLAEVARVVHDIAEEHTEADATRAMEFLSGFLQQARRGSLRALRMASRKADG